MPKLPVISGPDLIKALKKKGYILDRVSGSHHILVNQETLSSISIPVHKGRTLGKGITLAIIKDAGLTIEEFLKLK